MAPSGRIGPLWVYAFPVTLNLFLVLVPEKTKMTVDLEIWLLELTHAKRWLEWDPAQCSGTFGAVLEMHTAWSLLLNARK